VARNTVPAGRGPGSRAWWGVRLGTHTRFGGGEQIEYSFRTYVNISVPAGDEASDADVTFQCSRVVHEATKAAGLTPGRIELDIGEGIRD